MSETPTVIQDVSILFPKTPEQNYLLKEGEYVDPLEQFEERLEEIRIQEQIRRAQQRVLDEERAHQFCEENEELCNPPTTLINPEVPVPPQLDNCRWVLSSWYGSIYSLDGHQDGYHGRTAADGSTFNTYAYTVAHKTLPFGTIIQVRRADGAFVDVRVTDRGPFIGARELDFSRTAAVAAQTVEGNSLHSQGVGSVFACF